MAKVLRLHKGAADTIGNWDTSVKIGTKAIDSIADPIGAMISMKLHQFLLLSLEWIW